MDTEKESGKMSMLKVSDFPKNRESPFTKNIVEDVAPSSRRRIVGAANREVVQTISDQDGVITGQSAFVQYMEVDEKQFFKMYVSNLATFWDLSKPAMRVFTYIMSTVKPNNDTLDFDLEDCMTYCQYNAKSQVFKGLADLLQKSIIARGRTEYQYFINPVLTFNGDRVLFAKGLIKKKIKQQANQDQLNLFGNFEQAGLARLRQLEKHLDSQAEAGEEK